MHAAFQIPNVRSHMEAIGGALREAGEMNFCVGLTCGFLLEPFSFVQPLFFLVSFCFVFTIALVPSHG